MLAKSTKGRTCTAFAGARKSALHNGECCPVLPRANGQRFQGMGPASMQQYTRRAVTPWREEVIAAPTAGPHLSLSHPVLSCEPLSALRRPGVQKEPKLQSACVTAPRSHARNAQTHARALHLSAHVPAPLSTEPRAPANGPAPDPANAPSARARRTAELLAQPLVLQAPVARQLLRQSVLVELRVGPGGRRGVCARARVGMG